jgi:D-alanyl-lipoteichoic acid acyltransferase DltB (MBOAT superfamily)
MNFTSLFFLPLYALTAVLYPRLRPRHRTFLLLFSSWLFFLLESPASGVILLCMILLTFSAGLAMDSAGERPGLKKILLVTVLALCLGTLGLFKYTGLFFLPAGISFYTFQALSYTIDVYRGRFPAEKDFPRYALYLSFFPQVVAGPIERPGDLLDQLRCKNPVTPEDFRIGGFLMLRGYVKKIVIADALAPAADLLFAGSGGYTGPKVLAAAFLFALQIYADFSGYSDIALGSARILGIRLSENFREPYLAAGLRDFWRRWHITLTRWLTDYVYIPLGGNRMGPVRTALNTLLVFAVSGLWHGRGAHFLVWGLVHGLLLLAEDSLRAFLRGPAKDKSSGTLRISRVLLTSATFLTVSLLWILFRAPDLPTALAMYRALPLGWGQTGEVQGWIMTHGLAFVRTALAIPLLFLLRRIPDRKEVPPDMKALAGGYLLFVLTLISLFLNLQSGGAAAFIYFQF